MFANVERIADVAGKAVVEACWRQWGALTNSVALNQPRAHAVLDPEALVLMSLAARHLERRLPDLVLWWASVGSSLMSVQRMQTLVEEFPGLSVQDFSWFASKCLEAGDRRWKKAADGCELEIPARGGKGPNDLHLLLPSTLILRLRAGFGVGAKADLLAFLLGISKPMGEGEAWVTAETIATAISYSGFSVRRAVSPMVLAGFVRASGNRPTEYGVVQSAWAKVLGLELPSQIHVGAIASTEFTAPSPSELSVSTPGPGDVSAPIQRFPCWRFWAQVYGFLARCLEWVEESRNQRPVVQASRARDIVEELGRPLRWNGIDLPDARLYAGESYLPPFQKLVEHVARWTSENI